MRLALAPFAPFAPALAGALVISLAACQRTATVNPSPASGAANSMASTPFVQAVNDSVGGDYLALVGGCNDCHTPGWAESDGKTPEAARLVGSNVGYKGPWGTTYAANLRLVVQDHSEDEWVDILTTADGGKGKPPMPWMNTRQMNERDLRAIYRYIHALGRAGEPAPLTLPPGENPTTPFIVMVPQQP